MSFFNVLTIRKHAQQSKYFEFDGKSHDQGENILKKTALQNCKHLCPPRT